MYSVCIISYVHRGTIFIIYILSSRTCRSARHFQPDLMMMRGSVMLLALSLYLACAMAAKWNGEIVSCSG